MLSFQCPISLPVVAVASTLWWRLLPPCLEGAFYCPNMGNPAGDDS